MIRGDNHARHCAEFVAADFAQHVKQHVGIGLVDFKGLTDGFNFAGKGLVVNGGAAPRDFFGRQVEVSGGHC